MPRRRQPCACQFYREQTKARQGTGAHGPSLMHWHHLQAHAVRSSLAGTRGEPRPGRPGALQVPSGVLGPGGHWQGRVKEVATATGIIPRRGAQKSNDRQALHSVSLTTLLARTTTVEHVHIPARLQGYLRGHREGPGAPSDTRATVTVRYALCGNAWFQVGQLKRPSVRQTRPNRLKNAIIPQANPLKRDGAVVTR